MVKIVLIIKEDCPACTIVKKVISEAINKIECDVALSVISKEKVDCEKRNIKVFPTTLFYKSIPSSFTAFNEYKEIARLEGSFPIDYLNKVIDKLKTEYNE